MEINSNLINWRKLKMKNYSINSIPIRMGVLGISFIFSLSERNHQGEIFIFNFTRLHIAEAFLVLWGIMFLLSLFFENKKEREK
jgi:hypothetical protein